MIKRNLNFLFSFVCSFVLFLFSSLLFSAVFAAQPQDQEMNHYSEVSESPANHGRDEQARSTSPEARYKFMHVRELRQRMKQGQKLTILDVRADFAYEMEHIPSAVSLPLSDLKNQITLRPLPRDGIIVTYCSCPRHEGEMAYDLLATVGYHNVFVLYEGLPGWKKAGYSTVGRLANEPVAVYWVIGYVLDSHHKPKQGVIIRGFQPETQQIEIGTTNREGFYAIPLRFYGLLPGNRLQVSVGTDVIFFNAGGKADPWGIRIDDVNDHIQLVPEFFLKTFKAKRVSKSF